MSKEENLNQTFLERFDHKENFDEWERKMMAWGEVGTDVDNIQYQKTIVVTEWVPTEEKNDERPGEN